tara:strand:+ start:278 stop:532 length:255 start_codon:yes stop_codon:yes gene_type:complete
MNISLNTFIKKYYKGEVDGIKFIYDPENVCSEEVWTFGYKESWGDSVIAANLGPEYYDRDVWERKAKDRIEKLTNSMNKPYLEE